eukprot:2520069-Karenia_brevis.AAC.1
MRTTSADEMKNQTMIMTTCMIRSRDKGIRIEEAEKLNNEGISESKVHMFCDKVSESEMENNSEKRTASRDEARTKEGLGERPTEVSEKGRAKCHGDIN